MISELLNSIVHCHLQDDLENKRTGFYTQFIFPETIESVSKIKFENREIGIGVILDEIDPSRLDDRKVVPPIDLGLGEIPEVKMQIDKFDMGDVNEYKDAKDLENSVVKYINSITTDNLMLKQFSFKLSSAKTLVPDHEILKASLDTAINFFANKSRFGRPKVILFGLDVPIIDVGPNYPKIIYSNCIDRDKIVLILPYKMGEGVYLFYNENGKYRIKETPGFDTTLMWFRI